MGAVGMCWGAKVLFTAAKTGGLIDAVAACHLSFLTKQYDKEVQAPICVLNSNEEAETYATEIKPVVEAKPKSVHRDFPNMHHGWMGSRGLSAMTDFNKPEQTRRYQKGVTDLVFSKTQLLETT
jgi:dienelactone hydrolase